MKGTQEDNIINDELQPDKKNVNKKKKGDLNFKKWLLTLSSIGNLILGALLLIMALNSMRFKLDSIFVADRGLIVISLIIILSSILCFVGLYIRSFIILLIVLYNYILTLVFLSVFSLGAVTMNHNLIDWIDSHWDIIRMNVFDYDMNKFKNHVTTEINSLGIFSLTLTAIIIVSMACITNFLKFKNIIFALSAPINLIFSCLSLGIIIIGFYSYQNAWYGSIPRWSCVLIIVLGFLFLFIGIFGYISTKKLKKTLIAIHCVSISICLIGLLIATIGIFNSKGMIVKNIDKHWIEISKILYDNGYSIRKSYVINQLEIQMKLTGFYLIAFMIFAAICLISCIYQYNNIMEFLKHNEINLNYLSNYLSKEGSVESPKK